MGAERPRSAVVLGAGAVGGYLGARLSRADSCVSVTLIGRPHVVEAIRARGLLVREMTDTVITHPIAVSSLEAVATADMVLLTVRTYDVVPAISQIEQLIGDRGVALAFQNGVGTEEVLARELGRERVLAATLTVSEGMENPGEITRYSRGGGVALASMDGEEVPGWIVDAFAATGLTTIVVQDYRSLRWSKLLLNMLGAATTAILDSDVGVVMADPELFRLEQKAFREAGRVMDALRIRTVKLPGYPVPLARSVMRLPRPLAQRLLGRKIASARSGRSPGMRADLKRGKTEAREFNGGIAAAGAEAGIATPVNAALADLTVRLAEHPEERKRFSGNPAALLGYMRIRGIAC